MRGTTLAQLKIYAYIFRVVHIAVSGNDGVSWLTSAIRPVATAIQPGLTAISCLFLAVLS